MKIFFLSCLFLTLPVSAHAHEANSVVFDADLEAASLAQNLDDLVKACSSLVASTATKAGPKRPEILMRQSGRLQDLADPSSEQRALANPKHGPAKFYNWFDPHADILIVNYTEVPYCRAFVGNAAWAKEAKPRLEKLVQVGDFWKYRASDPLPGGEFRTLFSAVSGDGTRDVQLSISGFSTQTGTIAVALTSKSGN